MARLFWICLVKICKKKKVIFPSYVKLLESNFAK